MSVGKSILYTLFWLSFNVIFGIAQYFILLSADWLNVSKFGTNETIAGGVVLFFCAGLMASTSIDLVIAKPPLHEFLKYICYILPIIILLAIVVIFIFLNFIQLDEIPWGKYIFVHKLIIGVAFVFCLFLKYLIFKEENKYV